jgi:hypothetical protein
VRAEILLVGSMPFPTVEDVFRECCAAFGDALACLPDGEVGDRRNWTEYLPLRTFGSHPALEEVRRPRGGRIPIFPGQTINPGDEQDLEGLVWHFRLAPGVDELVFDDLHYAAAAIESYALFTRLRDEGAIPEHVRFQVNFPGSSSAIEEYFCEPGDWEVAKPAYEDAVRTEIERILEVIPAGDLAVQFDFSNEVVDLSLGSRPAQPWLPEHSPEEKLARHTASLSRLWRGIPDETLLGYHWCYGTWGGWPRTAMADLGLCVRLSNEAVARAGRRVDYVHMPVPRRPDDAVFAPLRELEIGDARVFLGLIHHDAGLDDLRARLARARAHLDDFGIAGPCGYGRVEAAELPAVLEAHRQSIAELRQTPE